MRKLLFIIACLLLIGTGTAEAQKKRTKRVRTTQKTTPKKPVVVKDTVTLFLYLEEHGVETSGVRLRKTGNDYLLTYIEAHEMRVSKDIALARSRERTEEMLARGYLTEEMMRGDSIPIRQIPGIEVKVAKSVGDRVLQIAEQENLQEMDKYYTSEEYEYITGGSWWSLEMQLPGKEKKTSGGRNGMGPRGVDMIKYYLEGQNVIYKRGKRK